MKNVNKIIFVNLVLSLCIIIFSWAILSPTVYKGQIVIEYATDWFRDDEVQLTPYKRKVNLLANVETNYIVAIEVEEHLANDGYESTVYDEDHPHWESALDEYYQEYLKHQSN